MVAVWTMVLVFGAVTVAAIATANQNVEMVLATLASGTLLKLVGKWPPEKGRMIRRSKEGREEGQS
jgi:hypothetical protein